VRCWCPTELYCIIGAGPPAPPSPLPPPCCISNAARAARLGSNPPLNAAGNGRGAGEEAPGAEEAPARIIASSNASIIRYDC